MYRCTLHASCAVRVPSDDEARAIGRVSRGCRVRRGCGCGWGISSTFVSRAVKRCVSQVYMRKLLHIFRCEQVMYIHTYVQNNFRRRITFPFLRACVCACVCVCFETHQEGDRGCM